MKRRDIPDGLGPAPGAEAGDRDGAPVLSFQKNALQGLSIVGVVLLTPFAVNNFAQGRWQLGAGNVLVVAILSLTAWGIRRGHYYLRLVSLGLIPALIFFLALAIRRQGIVGVLWAYPAVVTFYFILPERRAWVANAVMLAVALPQIARVLETPLAARAIATLLAVSIFSLIVMRVIAVQQQMLHRQAVTDPLTGLFNRAPLGESLEVAVAQHQRANVPMTLVAVDIDHFKSINDAFGHHAGDAVLRSVGELLRNRIRRTDKAFRIGGEEFLVLLYALDGAGGLHVAEELRGAIERLTAVPGRQVTASAGVATLQAGESWVSWMKRCDDNLYRAKTTGRNRVVAEPRDASSGQGT